MHHCLTINVKQIEEKYINLIKESWKFKYKTQINFLVEKIKREMNGIRITNRNKRGLLNLEG